MKNTEEKAGDSMKIEEVLEKEGIYVSTTSGRSMYPMLRDRKDTIIISPCEGRLKKYDVPLYRRGKKYVLHRVLKVKKDSYVIRGDNCLKKEYGIRDEQIVGVLTGFYRGEKKIDMNSLSYKAYARIWPALFPVRYMTWLGKKGTKKVLGKSGKAAEKKTEVRKESETELLIQAQKRKAGMYLLQLIRAALREEAAPEKPEDITWDQIYLSARRNSVEAISACGVEKLKEKPQESIWKVWSQEPVRVMHRVLQFDVEREQILAEMKKHGLSYLPLKGIRLASYYPNPGMRTMADNDILYGFVEKAETAGYQICGNTEQKKQESVERATKILSRIMKKRAYEVKGEGPVHDSYLKEPIFNFEMHKNLVSTDSDFYEYYKNPWAYAMPDEGDENGYHFSDEEEYMHFLTHAYKHFSHGGCGVRLLTDTYVFLQVKGEKMDWEYLRAQMDRCHITAFEQLVSGTVQKLFGENRDELTEEEENLIYYLLKCGTYGTLANAVENRIRKMDGAEEKVGNVTKARYIWHRLFPEEEWWKNYFPIGYKYPWLRPALTAYRIGKGLVTHAGRLKTEWKVVRKL